MGSKMSNATFTPSVSSAGRPAIWKKVEAYADWALETPDARWQKRRDSSPEELKSFYDALVPLLVDILAECDRFPFGELPETHRDLLNLALAAAEVAPHVELYKCSPKVPN